MIQRKRIADYPFDDLTLEEIIQITDYCISNKMKKYYIIQNTNKIYLSYKYKEIRDVIENSDLIIPENSIFIGSLILGNKLKQYNLTTNLVEELLRLICNKNYTIYFLGATSEIIEKAIYNVKKVFRGINIIGYHHGYIDINNCNTLIDNINTLKPNVLLIGMGSPKQELFIYNNFNKISTNIMLGMGGALKLLAGIEKAAPKIIKYGMEWLYRSIQDPIKFKRYFVINTFYLKELLIKEILK